MDCPVRLLPLLLLLVLLPGRNAAGSGAQLALGDQLTVAMRRIEQSCLAECANQVSDRVRADATECYQLACIPRPIVRGRMFSVVGVRSGAERTGVRTLRCFFAL